MGRCYVLTLLGGAAVWPLVARAQQSVGAGYARALEQAKRDYGKISKPSEAARSAYITRLVRLREQATRLKLRHGRRSTLKSKSIQRQRIPTVKPCRDLFSANGNRLDTIISIERTAPGRCYRRTQTLRMGLGESTVINILTPPRPIHRKRANTPSS